MTLAAQNIQCRPTPEMWAGAGSSAPAVDREMEDGTPRTTEDGTPRTTE